MATVTESESRCVEQIGNLAGVLWHALEEHGPLSFSKLAKIVEAPREAVAMSLGWLAREEKISIEDVGRGKVISLRQASHD